MAKFSFVLNIAKDDSVDNGLDLLRDGATTNISIQDCRPYGGGFAVNRYAGEGDEFSVTHLGGAKTLKRAKEIAVSFATAQ